MAKKKHDLIVNAIAHHVALHAASLLLKWHRSLANVPPARSPYVIGTYVLAASARR